MEYPQIRAALEPHEQRFDPLEAPLLSEDPDWRMPTDRASTEDLMKRLPRRAVVFCALVAAEMVLRVWELRYPEDKRPRDVINTTWRWFSGNVSHSEMENATDVVYTAVNAVYSPYITSASYTAGAAAYYTATATTECAAFNAANAVAAAAAAAVYSVSVDAEAACDRFYRRWWSECRRRLAIRDPEKDEVTWL